MDNAVWHPINPQHSNLWQFMRFVEKQGLVTFPTEIVASQELMSNAYQTLHRWSIDHPELFWQAVCEFYSIEFSCPPSSVVRFGETMLDTQWFENATLNVAERWLSHQDDKPALISISENGVRQVLSFAALREQVGACAEALKTAGVLPGSRVAAVLPNSTYAIIAMLATASMGAIWSSCSPEFGVSAIVDRFAQIEPTVLFVGDGHRYAGKTFSANEKNQQLLAALPSLKAMVLCSVIGEPSSEIKRPIVQWNDFLIPNAPLTFTAFPFTHPLYILFSSGTTGKPKCIIHGAGTTFLQHIKELGLHTDIKADDNLFFYTTCGWMMWNWMASALALGATLTLYDGSPTWPDTSRLFKLIEEENVTVFGTSAKFISAVEKANYQPNQHHQLNKLRCILSTGSPLLPANYDFVYQHINPRVQLSSISGGTDIVSCFALGNPLLPVYRGELQCLGLGLAVEVFDETGHSVIDSQGELVCTQPFPAMPIGFWNDPDKTLYHKAYFERFPNVWAHGDYAKITAHHGLVIFGRSDTILNPGGIRIGTAEIYRQIETISEIVDSVVIGQNWQEDVRVVLFVVLRPGVELNEALEKKIRQQIRHNASPRHVPAKIIQVKDIPRTINGKIVEVSVRQIVHGQPVSNLQALANPESLSQFSNLKELAE